MNLKEELIKRAENKCEICSAQAELFVYSVSPASDLMLNQSVLICDVCQSQIQNIESIDENHFRCLSQCMWSEHSSVKVLSWKMLQALKDKGWAQDLLSQIYLNEEELSWAESLLENKSDSEFIVKDSNGSHLSEGDTVTLIKDLEVKGAKFTAKRGTTVKGIHLTQNSEQVEGRVNGTLIVLLTKYLKKS